MKKFILLSSFLIATAVHGQTFQWAKDYSDLIDNVTITENNLYAAGRGVIAMKMDKSGNILWAKKSKYLNGNDIKLDNAGNIYVVGSFNGTANLGDTTLKATIGETFIAKLNQDGNILWIRQSKSYNSGADRFGLMADNSLLVTGNFSKDNYAFGGKSIAGSGGEDAFIMKINPNGNAAWIYDFGGPDDDNIDILAPGQGDEYYVAGKYTSTAKLNGMSLPGKTGETGFLALLNTSDGSVSIKEASQDFYYSKIVRKGPSYYFSALFRGTKQIGSSTFSSPSSFSALFVRADNDMKPVKGSLIRGGIISAFDIDENGSVLAGGPFYGQLKIGDTHTFSNKGESDFFLVKYKPNGTVEWAIQPSGPNIDDVYSIVSDKDNSFYVIATVQSGPVNLGNLKVQGNFSGSPFIAKEAAGTSGLNTLKREDFTFEIYPNPSSANLYINTQETEGAIRLVTFTGQVVNSILLHQGINKLDISGLPAGLYTIRVTNATGTSSRLVEIVR